MDFSQNPLRDPKIQDGWDPPSWKSTWHYFFSAEGGPIWIKSGAEWHVDCSDVVEIETRCRIPIWRTFGRIQWHVIPEPRITFYGAACWWIHCHDSRATCHIAGCSHLAKSMSRSCHIAGCKNSIRHIENRSSPYFIFWCLMQFRLWQAAAFILSLIHLFFMLNWINLFDVIFFYWVLYWVIQLNEDLSNHQYYMSTGIKCCTFSSVCYTVLESLIVGCTCKLGLLHTCKDNIFDWRTQVY